MSNADPTAAAVSAFWTAREDQMARLADGGAAGGAARAGGHMNAIRDLVADMVRKLMPEASIEIEPYLPGYYRARKRWDLAVLYKNVLVAAFEFKSQVGSVGKNYNNRFEEALGTATDTLVAHERNSPFGEIPPFLGYVFVLCEDDETERKRQVSALFPTDPIFDDTSYNERYQLMLSRFLCENVYQAGWFITTRKDNQGRVSYSEPLTTATSAAFRAAIEGRVNWVRTVLG